MRIPLFLLALLFPLTACSLLQATKTVEGIEGPARSVRIKADVRSNVALNGLADGFDGRSFRLRYWDIRPGGIVPLHTHRGRPATIYVVNSEILEFRNGSETPLVHKGGEISVESEGLVHHWRNDTDEIVHLVASDIHASGARAAAVTVSPVRALAAKTGSGFASDVLADVDLAGEAIGVTGYTLRTRRVTVEPSGATGIESFKAGPANAYLLNGTLRQSRTDSEADTVLDAGQSDHYPQGAELIWFNDGLEAATLIVSEIIVSE